MKENRLVVATSLLSVFFMSVHMAGDVIYGFDQPRAALIALPIIVLWLYAALILTESKWGHMIIMVLSLLGLVVPIIHMKGTGMGKEMADFTGGYFFVWTTLALGVTSLFSIVLAMRGLLRLPNSHKH